MYVPPSGNANMSAAASEALIGSALESSEPTKMNDAAKTDNSRTTATAATDLWLILNILDEPFCALNSATLFFIGVMETPPLANQCKPAHTIYHNICFSI